MAELLAYLGLFASALGAATILPMPSEAVLVGLILSEKFSTFWLIVVAGLGNVLGAVANWLLGRGIEHFRDRPWFPIKPTALERAQAWYRLFG